MVNRASAAGLSLLVLGAPAARAQQSELDVAAQFFEAGAAAARKREFRVCAEAFTEAHKRARHGATIYNAALCWDGDKEPARAANDYAEALELGSLSKQQEERAKKRLKQLEAELGRLALEAPKGVRATVGPIVGRPIPFKTYLTPGEHEVRVEGPSGDVTRTVTIRIGQIEELEIELEKTEAPTPVDTKPEPVRPASTSSVQRTTGWILVGASVVAAGVGAAFYASAVTARDEFEAGQRKNEEDRQRAIDRYSLARALWIGAGVGAAAGVTLILTSPSSPKPAALRVHPTGVSASLRF